MIKIISFELCPFVHRVRLVTLAKGIKHEVKYIDLKNKPEWFLNISPFGKVPVLVTEDDEVIVESEAIIEYLDEAYGPKIYPDNLVEKARLRGWNYFIAGLYPKLFQLIFSRDEKLFKKHKEEFVNNLKKIDDAINNNAGYFTGNRASMVDYALLPLFYRNHLLQKYCNTDFLVECPNLKRISNNVLTLDIIPESVSANFTELFVKLLSEKNSYISK